MSLCSFCSTLKTTGMKFIDKKRCATPKFLCVFILCLYAFLSGNNCFSKTFQWYYWSVVFVLREKRAMCHMKFLKKYALIIFSGFTSARTPLIVAHILYRDRAVESTWSIIAAFVNVIRIVSNENFPRKLARDKMINFLRIGRVSWMMICSHWEFLSSVQNS